MTFLIHWYRQVIKIYEYTNYVHLSFKVKINAFTYSYNTMLPCHLVLHTIHIVMLLCNTIGTKVIYTVVDVHVYMNIKASFLSLCC